MNETETVDPRDAIIARLSVQLEEANRRIEEEYLAREEISKHVVEMQRLIANRRYSFG